MSCFMMREFPLWQPTQELFTLACCECHGALAASISGLFARVPLWHLKQLDAPRPQAFASGIGDRRCTPSAIATVASPPQPSATTSADSAACLPARPATSATLTPSSDSTRPPRQILFNSPPLSWLRFIYRPPLCSSRVCGRPSRLSRGAPCDCGNRASRALRMSSSLMPFAQVQVSDLLRYLSRGCPGSAAATLVAATTAARASTLARIERMVVRFPPVLSTLSTSMSRDNIHYSLQSTACPCKAGQGQLHDEAAGPQSFNLQSVAPRPAAARSAPPRRWRAPPAGPAPPRPATGRRARGCRGRCARSARPAARARSVRRASRLQVPRRAGGIRAPRRRG